MSWKCLQRDPNTKRGYNKQTKQKKILFSQMYLYLREIALKSIGNREEKLSSQKKYLRKY